MVVLLLCGIAFILILFYRTVKTQPWNKEMLQTAVAREAL